MSGLPADFDVSSLESEFAKVRVFSGCESEQGGKAVEVVADLECPKKPRNRRFIKRSKFKRLKRKEARKQVNL